MSDKTAAGGAAEGTATAELPPGAGQINPPDQTGKPVGGFLSRLGGGGGMGRSLGLVVVLLIICVVGAITAGERFVSVDNMMTILRLGAILGVVSVGSTFVITAGGIDLSVGSALGLATVWASTLATQTMAQDFHWIVIALTAILVGTLAGVVNGIIIAYGKVVSFVATLAMLIGARGLAEIISNRQTQIIKVNPFKDFFGGNFLGIPTIVWIFIAVAILGWIGFNRTTFGRRTIAVGGNAEAARLAGIKIKRHMVYVFALSGFTVGIAAVMMLGRTGVGTSTHGMLLELDVIAAVVVGGTLLVGGRGTIVGTVLGVLIFTTLSNIFTLNDMTMSVQSVFKGVIIVVAVLLQQRFASRAKSV